MKTFAVDPGVSMCGVALFGDDGLLEFAKLVEAPDGDPLKWMRSAQTARDVVPDHCFDKFAKCRAALVAEVPQVYSAWSKSKGDPNDLVDVAMVVGYLAAFSWRNIFVYRPSEWKGQLPKDVTKNRAKKILSLDELDKVELPRAKDVQHNVWDAVGLGLFHLKRTLRQPAPQARGPAPT